MGEIKSTLDLVMERTRHLSLSDEERQRQQAEAFEKRLQGLLQQFADGALTVDEAGERIAALRSEMGTVNRKGLMAAIGRRIDTERDNAHWLVLVEHEVPDLREPLAALLEGHRRQARDLLASSGRDELDRLAREHAVSGTAVRYNPASDPACQERLAALGEETRAGIEALMDQIDK